MSNQENVVVYIDGGNLYKKLKMLGIPEKGKRFDYSDFVNYLVGERTLVSKRYYVGIVRNVDGSEKSEQMVRSQQKFLDALELEGFAIKRGKIMYDEGNIREKGVDVKLSVDLVVGAVDSLFDTSIIVSSDTDLIPAVKYIKKAKSKNIEYIGFGVDPSLGLIQESSSTRVFSKIDLVRFQKEK